MKLRLPESYLRPVADRHRERRFAMLLAWLGVCVAAWQLLGLPGALVKRYIPPADMPWYGFGLAGVFVEQDGRWVIHREGYADRKRKYQLSPAGALSRFTESDVYDQNRNTAGSKGRGVQLPGGGVLNVKPSRHYYDWLQYMRSGKGERQAESALRGAPGTAVQTGPARPAQLPGYGASPAEIAAGTPYVILRVYKDDKPHLYRVLSGHHYFPVYDSVCYVAPWLWLTTDRLRYIHRIYLDDSSGQVELREAGTQVLDPGARIDRDTSLGLDRRQGRLFILLSGGQRCWFDPRTLQLLSRDQLPGVWEAEYACLGDPRRDYNFERGYPITKAQYQLLMRSLVIVFLGCLLYLAVRWRHAWNFIAAATTEASSSSGRSSNT